MTYVQYGAGKSCPDGWINFDISPTLRIQKIPLIGPLIVPASQKFPEKMRFGDIVQGLPIAANSTSGVYASHVLEHLALDDFRVALQHTKSILAPGGVFRCVVPDLYERARRYVAAASASDPKASSIFMLTAHLGQEMRRRDLVGRLRALIGNSSHLWMWDEASLTYELEAAGFVGIRRCQFGDSNDPMFSRVESKHRFVDEDQTPEMPELAIEARRPA